MKEYSSSKATRLNTSSSTFSVHHAERDLWDRENKVPGNRHANYPKTYALVIGAGGMGGMVGLGLVRKGIGRLTICDGDSVEITNLNRQRFFLRDVGKLKALALANNLKAEGLGSIEITGIGEYFEEALELLSSSELANPNIVICCPDNDEVREFASTWCIKQRIPIVIAGLDDQSDHGEVSIQLPNSGNGCWQCLRKGTRGRAQCGVAANINLVLLISGMILEAVDRVIAGIELSWTYRRVSLSGHVPDLPTFVPKWDQCPACSQKESALISSENS